MKSSTDTSASRWIPVQWAALTIASLFLIVGALGFVPGVTTDYSTLEFAGHHSDAKVLGVFAVSILHNSVHLAFGIVGVVLARSVGLATLYLIGGGVVYALLLMYGLLVGESSVANFIPVNSADNWLHLGLAVAMLALGITLSRERSQLRRG